MFFSLAVMVMMVQCMQISRNNGISPTFIYGFFGGIVYSLQACGFLFGYGTETLTLNASPQLATFALVATWLFMIVAMAANGRSVPATSSVPDVEFVVLSQPPLAEAKEVPHEVLLSEHVGEALDEVCLDEHAEEALGGLCSDEHADEMPSWGIKDRISKQALVLTRRYLLTAREAEVMELLVRGNTAADIAVKLTISENTAKTHVKRLYTKLDVHKRRELLALFEELDE